MQRLCDAATLFRMGGRSDKVVHGPEGGQMRVIRWSMGRVRSRGGSGGPRSGVRWSMVGGGGVRSASR